MTKWFELYTDLKLFLRIDINDDGLLPDRTNQYFSEWIGVQKYNYKRAINELSFGDNRRVLWEDLMTEFPIAFDKWVKLSKLTLSLCTTNKI